MSLFCDPLQCGAEWQGPGWEPRCTIPQKKQHRDPWERRKNGPHLLLIEPTCRHNPSKPCRSLVWFFFTVWFVCKSLDCIFFRTCFKYEDVRRKQMLDECFPFTSINKYTRAAPKRSRYTQTLFRVNLPLNVFLTLNGFFLDKGWDWLKLISATPCAGGSLERRRGGWMDFTKLYVMVFRKCRIASWSELLKDVQGKQQVLF